MARLRDHSQPPLAVAPVGQVGMQEALEDAAVVGGEQVNELVDDDKLAEGAGKGEQLAVEGEAARVGTDGGRGAADVTSVGVGDRARE